MTIKRRVYYLLSFVAAVVFLTSCNKSNKNPDLPLPTMEGKNTMGCYVNGVVHSYSGEVTYLSADGVRFIDYTTNYQHYWIRGGPLGNKANGTIYMYAYSDSLQPHIIYDIYGASGATSFHRKLPTVQFSVKPNDPFNFVFFTRLDHAVAAGRFQFRAYSDEGDSVYVTLGRFDIAR